MSWSDIELSWKLHLPEHLLRIITYINGNVVTVLSSLSVFSSSSSAHNSFCCVRLWALPLKLTLTCPMLFIFPNLMAPTMTLGLLAWSLLFNHSFYGYMVKKICLLLSNLSPLHLIEHQQNTRVGKRTESSTKPGCEWIALPWGCWMVLLIPFYSVWSYHKLVYFKGDLGYSSSDQCQRPTMP